MAKCTLTLQRFWLPTGQTPDTTGRRRSVVAPAVVAVPSSARELLELLGQRQLGKIGCILVASGAWACDQRTRESAESSCVEK